MTRVKTRPADMDSELVTPSARANYQPLQTPAPQNKSGEGLIEQTSQCRPLSAVAGKRSAKSYFTMSHLARRRILMAEQDKL